MKFIWTKTGDSLDVSTTNPELVEHWLGKLPSNRFTIKQDHFPYDSIDRLKESLPEVNAELKKRFNMDIFDYGEFKLEQGFLNRVHRDWATVQMEHLNLPNILHKMGGDLLSKFYDINDCFHHIEHRSHVKYEECHSGGDFKNLIPGLPNPERFLQHGTSHLRLEYWGLGRSDWESWLNHDDIAHIDNFTALPYTFDVMLRKPYTAPYPADYIKWMEQKGKTPSGSYLPIGNFSGYEDSVGDLYEIFVKNNKVEQSVELTLF